MATQYVYDAAADGYNLLMGAENPALYDVLSISDLTYEDFECVYLIGDEVVGIIVGKDSKYESFTDIVEDALANPGTIKLSTTGTGGLPWEVGAFITDVTGATFNQIPYDSDASAKTAVMSGECDFTVCKVQSGIEDYLAGDIKYLCLLADEPVELMPEVPLITEEYPDFAKYLPWGPFYGIFVKSGTDAAIVETLSNAFANAGPKDEYQEVLSNFNINFLGYTGDEAAEYISSWRENIIGVLVGALPGAGGDIAALLSYDQAKRSIKKPTAPFGEGAVEGIIAPESANNAAIGGAFIPMLTLGIPGDAVTAVLISALTIQGLRPGPNLITNTPDLFYLIVSCLLLASIFLLVFGLTGIKVFTKIVEIPKGILMPMILVLSVIGAFAIRNSVYDILWMFGFGVIGYFLKRYDYPIAPIVLGVILTTLFEENYRRGVMLEGSILGMLASIFTSPISIVLFVLIVGLSVTQTGWYKNWRKRKDDALFAKREAEKNAAK